MGEAFNGDRHQHREAAQSLPVPLPSREADEPPLRTTAPRKTTPSKNALIDSFGRVHNNLRISVTDRCNLRCTYCMPEDVSWLDKADLLTFEEMARFVRIAASLGVAKIRLTGGEPLLRHRLADLVKLLVQIKGIDDIGLTTNALLLGDHAHMLHKAGVHRLNISLDTLRTDVFKQLARRDGLEKVLAGIEAARTTGFDSIKLNAVIIRGVNDGDIIPLARYAADRGLEMRFIEYMPIGAEPWERHKAVLAHEILEQLETEFGPLAPAENYDPRAPAMEFRSCDGQVRIGMIASISRPFCRQCNRIRITADGKLRHCLFALEETDIRLLMRDGVADDVIGEALRATVWEKWEGHEINSAKFIKPGRTMHAIGG